MEYIYAAMLIHKAGKKVEEATVKKVLEAVGVQSDEAKIKALVASLEGVNIDEAIKSAAATPVAATPAVEKPADKPQEKESEKKEEKKEDANAAAGLGALFG